MSALRKYRHGVTGLTQWLSPRVAEGNPHLTLIADDAKPLAYLPIPQEVIEGYLASASDVPDEGEDEQELAL